MDVSGLSIVALITWLVTALDGFYMMGIWIARGGVRQGSASGIPPALRFGHFLLAAAGLVVRIVYLFVDLTALAWAAFVTPPERGLPVPIVVGHAASPSSLSW